MPVRPEVCHSPLRPGRDPGPLCGDLCTAVWTRVLLSAVGLDGDVWSCRARWAKGFGVPRMSPPLSLRA